MGAVVSDCDFFYNESKFKINFFFHFLGGGGGGATVSDFFTKKIQIFKKKLLFFYGEGVGGREGGRG